MIEESLANLKVKLDGAVTDADLSDVALRCRRLLVDVMAVVYRPEMVPEGTKPPSPQDADEMLGHYLAVRLPGKDNEAYRNSSGARGRSPAPGCTRTGPAGHPPPPPPKVLSHFFERSRPRSVQPERWTLRIGRDHLLPTVIRYHANGL